VGGEYHITAGNFLPELQERRRRIERATIPSSPQKGKKRNLIREDIQESYISSASGSGGGWGGGGKIQSGKNQLGRRRLQFMRTAKDRERLACEREGGWGEGKGFGGREKKKKSRKEPSGGKRGGQKGVRAWVLPKGVAE